MHPGARAGVHPPLLFLTPDSEVSRQGAFDGGSIFKVGAYLAHLTHLAVSWIWATSLVASKNELSGLRAWSLW
jgi:hypothetical protein